MAMRRAAAAALKGVLAQSRALEGTTASHIDLLRLLSVSQASSSIGRICNHQGFRSRILAPELRCFYHLLSPAQSPSPSLSPAVDQDQERRGDAAHQAGSQQQAEVQVSTSSLGAEQCDVALGTLQQARTKYERARAPYGTASTYRRQARAIIEGIVSGTRTVLLFTLQLPGNILRFTMLPNAEKLKILGGWWKIIKKEAHHYWVGTKLLAADVQIASRLVYKAMQGKSLSRRERRQLTRTTADVFRLVPFAIFVIVPFMELLLPVALRLFPNMLPSTFEDKLKKEEELKKRVGVKLEVARFLQDTVQEMAKDIKTSKTGAIQSSAAELYEFMKKVRSGAAVSNYEIMRFAALFNDELTLDNLERIHLVNLCRFVGISPYGTDAFLVDRLRNHLSEIKEDDRAIKEEGLDNLTEEELRSASRARGMRAPYGEGAVAFMRRQMTEWLDLSLNRALPSSLLLLSRVFTMTQEPDAQKAQHMESIKDTISALPNKAIEVAISESAEKETGPADIMRKLEYLRREEELIREEELEAEALLSSGDQPSPVQASQTAPEMAAAAAAAAVVREAAASATMDILLEGESEEEKASKAAAAKEEKMRKVISALAVLSSSSGVSNERQAFMKLVSNEIDRLNSSFAKRGNVSMVFQSGGVTVDAPDQLQEVVGQKRLADKVSGILERIEKEIDNVEAKIGKSMHVLDLDGDGLVSKDELEVAMGFLKDQLGEDELRMLLERLNAFSDGQGTIDVGKLMDIATASDSTPPKKDGARSKQ